MMNDPCKCGKELRWDTNNGGHWMHVDGSITDHEAVPQGQPIVDETRTVNGSIDDLSMTKNGKWIPKL